MAVVLLAVAGVARAGGPIAPGDDLWVTPAGGTYDVTPIPGGFFDPGSDPFLPPWDLQGVPLNNDAGIGPVDTIVRRPTGTSNTFTCGSTETIPIEIVALSLRSVAPITVTYNGGNNPELWDVDLCLDTAGGPQPQGSMTVNHECQEGGTYSADLPVRARLTFIRQSDGETRELVHTVDMFSDGYWQHNDPGFGLLVSPPGSMWDTDCDGVPDTAMLGSSPAPNGFFPGLWNPSCSDCGTPITPAKKPLTSEQALLASHGVFTANGDKPQQVQTEACDIVGLDGVDRCIDAELSHCGQRGGTPRGPGSRCGDPTGGACQPNADQTECIGTCPDAADECQPRCATIDPFSGATIVDLCDCIPPQACHAEIKKPGDASVPCISPTGELPPEKCPYVSPADVHEIVSGLPPGTTIELEPVHAGFNVTNKGPGGNLGGEFEQFDSFLFMDMRGTGTLAGFNRFIDLQVLCETHTGPRDPAAPVQTFPNDMFALQGQLPPGDPDFDLLRITAGTAFGMPSPGHTTLTQLPGGDWTVDSFFDITYRIDFEGAPGGPLDGMSGSTTGTIRMQAGTPNRCEGFCPPGEECVETRVVHPDGRISVCCDCEEIEEEGACCDPVTGDCFNSAEADCPGTFHPGQNCTGPQACCIPGGATDFCLMVDPLCCEDMGGTPQPGQVCTTQEACCLPGGFCLMMDPVCCLNTGGSPGGAGSICQGNEACCFQDGTCQDLDRTCCLQQGGTPQGAGSDCGNTDCQEAECGPDPNGPGCAGDCQDPATQECLPKCVKINPATGAVEATDCDCVGPDDCHVKTSVLGGGTGGRGVAVAGGAGNPCVVPDNGGGTVTLPPDGCEYLSPEDVHEIIDGLPAGTTIEFDVIHGGFVCDSNNGVCSFPLSPGARCDQDGGSLGGAQECSLSTLDMTLDGTGTLSGYNRNIVLPIAFETHTAPRTPGDAVQSFDTQMFRLFGQITGDPDFDLLRFTAGTDFGLPSPGHTTLTQLPGGDWTVDSFFDITYRIDFVGAPGGPLAGMSGSTTGTIRMTTGAGDTRCEGVCPPGAECHETRTVNADGTVDLCCDCVTPECGPNDTLTDCVGACADSSQVCEPLCVTVDPNTGAIIVDECDCIDPETCHVDLGGTAGRGVSVAGGGAGDPCVVTDNGSGTVTLPPDGCEYLSPDEVHEIIDGLPAGTTIEFGTIHKDFMCRKQNMVCSFPPGVDCEDTGGTLGGAKECSSSVLDLDLNGTGTLAGYQRNIVLPIDFETHTAPRTPGDPVQSFDTDMFRMFGQITGDPDFDLLRVVAGTDFGLPSPGHTTLTLLPSGDWTVDSFFDITYRIDFVGAPGGPLDGMSGSTTGTIRMVTGSQPSCVGACPPGEVCVRDQTVNADGTISVCCRCEPEGCEPAPGGQTCNNVVCPTPGDECVPQVIKCDTTGCRVTVCDCQPPTNCHVDMPTGTGNTPICVGGCPLTPPNQRCILFRRDLDGNGLPDDYYCRCVRRKPAITVGPIGTLTNRYLVFELPALPLRSSSDGDRTSKSEGSKGGPAGVSRSGGSTQAIRIKAANLPQFPGMNGQIWWAGPPAEICEDPASAGSPPNCLQGSFTTSTTVCDPHFGDWSGVTVLHVRGPDIVPGPSEYIVQIVDDSCDDLDEEECYSDPVTVPTQKWGDLMPPFGGASQPNIVDINAVVDKFRGMALPPKSAADLAGHIPDLIVNIVDLQAVVDAFRGLPYPFAGPCACPPASTCPMNDGCGRCAP